MEKANPYSHLDHMMSYNKKFIFSEDAFVRYK